MYLTLSLPSSAPSIPIMKNVNTVGRVTAIADLIFGIITENNIPNAKKNIWTNNNIIEINRNVLELNADVATIFAMINATELNTMFVKNIKQNAAEILLVTTFDRLTGLESKKSTVLPLSSLDNIPTPRFIA